MNMKVLRIWLRPPLDEGNSMRVAKDYQVDPFAPFELQGNWLVIRQPDGDLLPIPGEAIAYTEFIPVEISEYRETENNGSGTDL
jgi:hypothetical protein